MRDRMAQAVHAGPLALPHLANELLVVGTKFMDFYHGPFSPSEIGTKIMAVLTRSQRAERADLQTWLDAGAGYRMIDFPEDTSRWVIRLGDHERYVHVHPARYSPFTVRVRASALRTSVLALVYAKLHGSEPTSRSVINAVRTKYLNLSPIGRDATSDEGMGAMIELLR